MAGATTPKPTATAKATAVSTATSRGRPANGCRQLVTKRDGNRSSPSHLQWTAVTTGTTWRSDVSSARHRRSGALGAPLAVAAATGAAALVGVLVAAGLQPGDDPPAPPHRSASRSPDLVMVEPESGSTGSTPGRTGSGGSRSGAAATSATAAAAAATAQAGAGSGTRPPSTPPEPATTAAARTHPPHPSHPAHPTQAATSPSR